MRVLILSCNTGEGHNSCAKAVKEIFDAHGDFCVIDDALRFLSKGVSKFISGWHVRIYRHMPALFRFGYGYSERHPELFCEPSALYRFFTGGSDAMHDYISGERFDAVICVHVFSSLMLTAMLKKHEMNLKTCFVATDYTCSPITRESRLDRYFIPDASLACEFEFPHIPKEKTAVSGIPIRQMFYSHTDKALAKEFFGIAPKHKHLLIMCGSMGCGPIERLTKILDGRLEPDCEITIVCGTNNRLRQRLEKKYSGRTGVHVKGFVDDMSRLMDSADLYLTKPGGLSVTEASVKALPMVCINAVAGCEEYNRRFFVQRGGAKTGASVKELASACIQLLSDDTKLKEMSEALRGENSSANAAEYIYCAMREPKIDPAAVCKSTDCKTGDNF